MPLPSLFPAPVGGSRGRCWRWTVDIPRNELRYSFETQTMSSQIEAIAYYLPERVLSNQDLAEQFPGWSIEKIQGKTGIEERRIAAEDQCSSDLAVAAAQKLFASTGRSPSDVDYLLLCTQSPDYFL